MTFWEWVDQYYRFRILYVANCSAVCQCVGEIGVVRLIYLFFGGQRHWSLFSLVCLT